ncbi:hypothetical protein CLOM_g15980 [Closterium sp. NIES-68]|nr:hypothetical protein CLOM_g10785 [Closterium sp. NIES-68]GJP56927.1 hypothetical protein CLOM_g15980 [Closterium sp. NIES-68]GJP85694.1 hypothetical protein CLOP_g15805 [Closterium sp. NIES-67]
MWRKNTSGVMGIAGRYGRCSGFTAQGIKYLYDGLFRLKHLVLSNTGILDADLEGIGALGRLEKLVLIGTKVTDAGLAHLARLASLECLDLERCSGVTSAGMVHAGKLTSLKFLDLEGTKVTNDGLRHLKFLTNLKALHSPYGTGDAGLQPTRQAAVELGGITHGRPDSH